MSKITIVTATYKRPDILYRCLLGVHNQTFQDFAHIVVGDNCPYAEAVYNLFQEEYQDKRVSFYNLTHKEADEDQQRDFQGTGPSQKGLELAESEWICYCNDDHIFLPNHLQTLDTLIQDNIDMLVGYTSKLDVHVNNMREICKRPLYDPSNAIINNRFFDTNVLLHNVEYGLKVGGWISACTTPDANDNNFIKRLGEWGETSIHSTIITGICFRYKSPTIKWGQFNEKNWSENTYAQDLEDKPQDQIFVYPELKPGSNKW